MSPPLSLTSDEYRLLRRLNSPRKIQDFVNAIPVNFPVGNSTCLSPRRVLRENRAHCIEGAMLAALALRLQGHKPLLLDLISAHHDFDHVVALFRQHDRWGAISKTNHAVLRYREPVYKTVRELALSFFHEYFDDRGFKTLRSFSRPMDLSRLDKREWITNEKDVWFVIDALRAIPHETIMTRAQITGLRKADALEIAAGKLEQEKNSTKP